jgi:hypothetical protein
MLFFEVFSKSLGDFSKVTHAQLLDATILEPHTFGVSRSALGDQVILFGIGKC